MRAIMIDPSLREVREADIENTLEEFQRIVGGGFVEFGLWINNRRAVRQRLRSLKTAFADRVQARLFGCGLITGGDGKGSDVARPARVPLGEVRNAARFSAV
jgi:hypothetical protein